MNSGYERQKAEACCLKMFAGVGSGLESDFKKQELLRIFVSLKLGLGQGGKLQN